MTEVKLSGLVPQQLKVRSARIVLESLEVQADIGFHDFEVGAPQRLIVSAEIWLEDASMPADDDPSRAWNYDFLRQEIEEIAGARRYPVGAHVKLSFDMGLASLFDAETELRI